MTEIKLATSKCHRIKENVTKCVNDQQQSFRPLVNSTVDQFLTDHVPATVKDLFQTVSVLDLQTINQLLKKNIQMLKLMSFQHGVPKETRR